MSIDVKQTFDNEASEYEFTSRAVNIYFDEALDELVKHILVKKKNPKILDVCCGTGILTEKVAKAYPNASFTGVDFSEEMLNIAIQRLKNYKFNYLITDVLDCNKMKKLGKYDLIISSFGIHNIHGLKNKKVALANILQHLNKGGQYISCDFIKGKDNDEVKKFYNFQKSWLLKTYNKKQTEEWLALLKDEDDPETMESNLKLLQNCGMQEVSALWNKEFLAIWQAIKK